MTIQTKILATTLPISLGILLVSFGVNFSGSRMALRDLATIGLEIKTDEGLKAAKDAMAALQKLNSEFASMGVKNLVVDSEQEKSEAKRTILATRIGHKGYLYIVDSKGKVIAHPESQWVGKSLSSEPWFASLGKSQRGTFVYSFEGQGHLASFGYFEPWDWYIVATEPLSDIYGAVESSDRFVLLISLFGAALLTFSIAWVTRKITRPVRKLTSAVLGVAAGDYGQEIDVQSNDEIGILATSFREMSVAITRRDEEIRRAERQLSEIFAAVPLGIISVEAGGIVGPKYSSYTEWLLNSNEIGGRPIQDLLYSNSIAELPAETLKAIHKIPNLFGKAEINWELTKFFLPTQIHFKLPPSHPEKDRYIELTYQAVFQKEGLSRILLVLEDRTAAGRARLEAEETALHENKSVLRLMQIKKAPERNLDMLMAELVRSFSQVEGALHSKDEAKISLLLHSIKGSARVLGLRFIAEMIHKIELKHRVDSDEQTNFDWTLMESSVAALTAEWRESYGFYVALTGHHNPAQAAALDVAGTEKLQATRQLLLKLVEPDRDFRRIHWALHASQCVRLMDQESVVRLRVSETARQLGKEVSLCFDIDPLLHVDRLVAEVYGEALLHLINNSIAHGIRKKGCIKVGARQQGDMLVVEFSDDGVGIDVEALKRSAIQKGFLTEERARELSRADAIELLFLTGVTSQSRSDLVSGLGIGMDAVRSRVQSLGGDIRVQETSSKGTTFVFRLRSLGHFVGGESQAKGEGCVLRTPALLQELKLAISDLKTREGFDVSCTLAAADGPRGNEDERRFALAVSTLAGHLFLEKGPVTVTGSITAAGEPALLVQCSQGGAVTAGGARPNNRLIYPEFYLAHELCRYHVIQKSGKLREVPGGFELGLGLGLS